MTEETPVRFALYRTGSEITCNRIHAFGKGVAALYILAFDAAPGEPVYVGEIGRAQSYDLRGRLRAHLSRRCSETRARLHKNLVAQGVDSDLHFVGYAFRLDTQYQEFPGRDANNVVARQRRQSLEAAVIHQICLSARIASRHFAVSKFSFGSHYRDVHKHAEAIIEGYQRAIDRG